MESVSSDVLRNILGFLFDVRDVVRCRAVCRQWRSVIDASASRGIFARLVERVSGAGSRASVLGDTAAVDVLRLLYDYAHAAPQLKFSFRHYHARVPLAELRDVLPRMFFMMPQQQPSVQTVMERSSVALLFVSKQQGATPILFRYLTNTAAWSWSPTGIIWMPLDTIRVTSGLWGGATPVTANVTIIKHMHELSQKKCADGLTPCVDENWCLFLPSPGGTLVRRALLAVSEKDTVLKNFRSGFVLFNDEHGFCSGEIWETEK